MKETGGRHDEGRKDSALTIERYEEGASGMTGQVLQVMSHELLRGLFRPSTITQAWTI